jgi:hypothetical protein
MFCPQCMSEYREGVTKCADCGVPLVRQLPVAEETPPGPNLDEMTLVLRTYDEGELLMVKSLLEAAGIPVHVPGAALTELTDDNVFGGPSFAAGPAQLFVPADRAEEAKEVLKSPPAIEDEES